MSDKPANDLEDRVRKFERRILWWTSAVVVSGFLALVIKIAREPLHGGLRHPPTTIDFCRAHGMPDDLCRQLHSIAD